MSNCKQKDYLSSMKPHNLCESEKWKKKSYRLIKVGILTSASFDLGMPGKVWCHEMHAKSLFLQYKAVFWPANGITYSLPGQRYDYWNRPFLTIFNCWLLWPNRKEGVQLIILRLLNHRPSPKVYLWLHPLTPERLILTDTIYMGCWLLGGIGLSVGLLNQEFL